MDGALDMDTVEKCWGQSSRNEVRRLQKDENGLSGMANYIVKEKKRIRSEKRWNSSQGLKDPDIRVVHSKRPTKTQGSYKKIATYVEEMRKGHEQVKAQMKKWYPDFSFTDAGIYYNDFNSMFYIRARLRKRRKNEDDEAGMETSEKEKAKETTGICNGDVSACGSDDNMRD